MGAYADAVSIIGSSGLPPRDVCVHCFTGGPEELALVTAAGFRVGFTGFVGVAKRAQRTVAAIRAAKLDLASGAVLIETDAPFMSPDKRWL